MQEKILLAHGGGGLLTSQLIREEIASRFANPCLDQLDDSAVFASPGERLAFTSDSYIVSPIFFPGGNIGDLAVCGTVNDLAMAAARPLYLSLALILEEGLPLEELRRVLDSIAERAQEAQVQIVCGDTKVVPKGDADGLYINTAGIGVVADNLEVSSHSAKPGDCIILSGALGLHGLAVMLSRGEFKLSTPVKSDVAPLNGAVEALIKSGITLRVLRDLTRGGLSMALHDIAENSAVTVEVEEKAIPSDPAQSAACEILGLDPLHVACEGRFITIVPEEDAAKALACLRGLALTSEAAIIGRILERGRYPLELVTAIGSRRVVIPPRGEQMPRIC
ncbi:MAG: hydrogenase expression/formation protein HypE [Planctomycetes bacterium]|nr:hydrogenase expression/formation protein HypE [Planctomycetota bacterium]